jgi:hypothetical protein
VCIYIHHMLRSYVFSSCVSQWMTMCLPPLPYTRAYVYNSARVHILSYVSVYARTYYICIRVNITPRRTTPHPFCRRWCSSSCWKLLFTLLSVRVYCTWHIPPVAVHWERAQPYMYNKSPAWCSRVLVRSIYFVFECIGIRFEFVVFFPIPTLVRTRVVSRRNIDVFRIKINILYVSYTPCWLQCVHLVVFTCACACTNIIHYVCRGKKRVDVSLRFWRMVKIIYTRKKKSFLKLVGPRDVHTHRCCREIILCSYVFYTHAYCFNNVFNRDKIDWTW